MKIEEGYWNGWEVYIEDKEGNRLPEHAILHTPPQGGSDGKVTLFIECQSQQELAICTRAPPAYRSFDADINYSVDGRRLLGHVYPPNSTPCRRCDLHESVNGEIVNRHLQFCKLEMSEDGPLPSTEALASLGVITVSLAAGDAEPTGRLSVPYIPSPPTTTVNEKTKKGMQQFYVGGGSNVEWSPRPTYRVALRADTPKYEFRISYRTRALLMAQDIIPNDNAAPVSDAGSDHEIKTKSETDSDATAVEDAKPNLKRKRGGERRTTVKATRNNKKKARPAPVVVDLTVDSDSE